jgi:hypothetical protein
MQMPFAAVPLLCALSLSFMHVAEADSDRARSPQATAAAEREVKALMLRAAKACTLGGEGVTCTFQNQSSLVGWRATSTDGALASRCSAEDSSRGHVLLDRIEKGTAFERAVALAVIETRYGTDRVDRCTSKDTALAKSAFRVARTVQRDTELATLIRTLLVQFDVEALGLGVEFEAFRVDAIGRGGGTRQGLIDLYQAHPGPHTVKTIDDMLRNPDKEIRTRALFGMLHPGEIDCPVLLEQVKKSADLWALAMALTASRCPQLHPQLLGVVLDRTSQSRGSTEDAERVGQGLLSICAKPPKSDEVLAARLRAVQSLRDRKWIAGYNHVAQCDPMHAWTTLMDLKKGPDKRVAEEADKSLDYLRERQIGMREWLDYQKREAAEQQGGTP